MPDENVEGSLTIDTKPSPAPSFALAKPAIRVAPSLLAADFARLEEEVSAVERAGAEVLHLDVMDGHFVPNISFGVPVIRSLRKRSRMFFDAHLMITEPQRYAEAFVKAGCDLITFHIEVADEPQAIVEHLRSLGVAVGVSLNPTTPASAIGSIIADVDLVLVMSVWPGLGGQAFISEVLPKIRKLHKALRPDQRLEIDGGINVSTVGAAAEAGADTLVAGTAVFGQPDSAAAMKELENLAIASWPGRNS
ncbi:MAG: ribulose-phosphate 3-epimerase [Planctomycetes bacterium]|nr:ribulose-phosphate 3-epimerase [Planctomycetota bacterium]